MMRDPQRSSPAARTRPEKATGGKIRFKGFSPRRRASSRWVGVYYPDREIPMAALRLLVRSGSFEDPPGREGLAYLTAQLLLEGSGKRTGQEIHAMVDGMGGRLFVECSADYMLLGMNVLRENLEAALDLLVGMLREPAFPAEEFEKKRTKIQGEIASQEDRPSGLAHRTFLETLFGRGGYGHDPRGFLDSLERIGIQEVRDHHAARLQGREAVLVAVGDLEVEACHERIHGLMEGWASTGGSSTTRGSPGDCAAPPARRVAVRRAIPQTTVILGQETIPRDHPDVYGMFVMNYILGSGGFDSRLMEEIRSKRGLAYGASSGLDLWLRGGSFRITFQTKNESAREAEALAVAEAERIRGSLVSHAEVEGAKRFLIGSFPMRLDSNASVASSLALWECYSLGMDYPARFVEAVEAVDRSEVRRVAAEHLHPEQWVQVEVGDLNAEVS